MYYMRIQKVKGEDLEYEGTLGECIKEVVSFNRQTPDEYRGHFILKR